MTAKEPARFLDRLRAWLGRVAIRLAPGEFEIDHHPGGPTRVRGQVPAAKVGAIQEFVGRDLRPEGRLLIRGSWGQRRSLHLRFAGAISAGDRQRTRNFLFELLR